MFPARSHSVWRTLVAPVTRNANGTFTHLVREEGVAGSGIPSFFAVSRNKRIKSAENLSEKNRNEPIKRAQAGGVWEKVEYRLDE